MVSRASSDAPFHVKILDFGLAKYVDAPQPQSIDHLNSLMGSVHYMAPEQFQRLPIDHRTDLYSLGCIFYEALTGHPAYDGENVSELIDAHLKKSPHPMKQLRRDISPRLERWINRFLERDAAKRWPNAAEALRAMPTLTQCGNDPSRTTGVFLKAKTTQRLPKPGKTEFLVGTRVPSRPIYRGCVPRSQTLFGNAAVRATLLHKCRFKTALPCLMVLIPSFRATWLPSCSSKRVCQGGRWQRSCQGKCVPKQSLRTRGRNNFWQGREPSRPSYRGCVRRLAPRPEVAGYHCMIADHFGCSKINEPRRWDSGGYR
jgi:serine/threonine protein kinase